MRERRRVPRPRTFLGARIAVPFLLSETACLLRNLSPDGARIALSGAVPLPIQFDLAVDHRGSRYRAEIVWRAGDALGVRFVDDGELPVRHVAAGDADERSSSDRRRLH